MKVLQAFRGYLPELLAVLFGFCWFLLLGGGRALHTTNLDWLLGDRTMNLIGWLLFRNSAWGLPLGRLPEYFWPVGTAIAFSDSIPLLAVPLKLFSNLLPTDFQFVGPWLALCFALQGVAGARLVAVASNHPLHRLFGGALFVIAPPLTRRMGHDALCAQFVLVAMLTIYLGAGEPANGDADGAKRAIKASAILLLLATPIHPYLATMVLGLVAALFFRLRFFDRTLDSRQAARWGGLLLLAWVAELLLFGYLTAAPSHGGGFGLFSADLLTWLNPFGASRFLSDRPAQAPQWEGNAYLGIGVLALLMISVISAALARAWPDSRARRALIPLFAICGLFWIFALSPEVRLDGRLILDLHRFYAPLNGLTGPYRSSGRFIWPLYYFILSGAILLCIKAWRERPAVAAAILGCALALQLFDLSATLRKSHFPEEPWRLQDSAWELATGLDHIALYPPQTIGHDGPCGDEAFAGPTWKSERVWAPFGYLAYRLHATINSGDLARSSRVKLDPVCRQLESEIAGGSIRDRTLYIVQSGWLEQFNRLGHRAVCGQIEGYAVCVTPSAPAPLLAYLAAHHPDSAY